MRGDDLDRQAAPTGRRGTPPRARGRPLEDGDAFLGEGNTPACAGTTRTSARTPTPATEHPRVRGDDVPGHRAHVAEGGTPPRARGRPHQPEQSFTEQRNTPACAGTTQRRPARPPGTGEHPRVRGDDGHAADWGWCRHGTPPRARGRLRCSTSRWYRSRNTPACAGTTGDSAQPSALLTEHPRRARGRRHTPDEELGGRGNTPACAGTTRPGRR